MKLPLLRSRDVGRIERSKLLYRRSVGQESFMGEYNIYKRHNGLAKKLNLRAGMLNLRASRHLRYLLNFS